MHTATVSIVRDGRVIHKTINYSPAEAKARLKYLFGFDEKVRLLRRPMLERTAQYT